MTWSMRPGESEPSLTLIVERADSQDPMELEMDRSFIDGIDVDPSHAAFTEAIARLTRSLDLDLIAEGVETEHQLEALGQIGCENIQGFLAGRPMPAKAVPEWQTVRHDGLTTLARTIAC